MKYGQLTLHEKNRISYWIRRNGGLPREMRPQLWLLASGAERAKRNNPDYYLVRKGPPDGSSRFGAEEIVITRPILDSYTDMPDPYKEQIELDLRRTFTDDEEF